MIKALPEEVFHTKMLPHLSKKKQRSLTDIYTITEPLEELFMDLHVSENSHEDEAYGFFYTEPNYVVELE
jgi:hypothetical protein